MDGYSRLIAWLKVLLPLMALALLSTLFLLSRDRDNVVEMPFAETEIRDRVAGQQVTEPYFSGVSPNGDRIVVAAERLVTIDGQIGENQIAEVSAQFDLTDGTRVNLVADEGRVSMTKSEADLSGDVHFTTSSGFTLSSEYFVALINRLDIRSPGPVEGDGPFGTLDAGAMAYRAIEGQESPHLLFTNRVKLIYKPGGAVE